MSRTKHNPILVAAALFALALLGCDSGKKTGADAGASGGPVTGAKVVKLAFVTNNPSQFWKLTRPDRVHWYNKDGYIERVEGKNGVVLMSFTYSGTQVTKVTDAAGRIVQFSWTNGRVSSVVDPAGKTWSYAYDANGMLQSVTAPGSLS